MELLLSQPVGADRVEAALCLIKEPLEAGRGIWSLTEKGRAAVESMQGSVRMREGQSLGQRRA